MAAALGAMPPVPPVVAEASVSANRALAKAIHQVVARQTPSFCQKLGVFFLMVSADGSHHEGIKRNVLQKKGRV